MKKSELIVHLNNISGDPDVFIEIQEPYQEQAETLTELATDVSYSPVSDEITIK